MCCHSTISQIQNELEVVHQFEGVQLKLMEMNVIV